MFTAHTASLPTKMGGKPPILKVQYSHKYKFHHNTAEKWHALHVIIVLTSSWASLRQRLKNVLRPATFHPQINFFLFPAGEVNGKPRTFFPHHPPPPKILHSAAHLHANSWTIWDKEKNRWTHESAVIGCREAGASTALRSNERKVAVDGCPGI